jgi:Ca-activated chloride channel family protein
MSDIHFTDIRMLLLLWLLPPLWLLFLHAAARRRKAMAAFIEPALAGRCGTMGRPAKRGRRFLLFCLALACMIIALARPAWNLQETTVKRSGRDLVFMVDVSKSMLAADLMPNRLERAKLAIRDCVEKLQGDRIALVAFAGTASVKCPLTQDYAFFLMMLDAISTDSSGRGGTLIGDALRATFDQVFDDQEKQFKDIILITDGEDHESFPVQAAEKIGDACIRLLIIGLGDEKEGQRIPVTTADGKTSFLKYNGQEVWSRLDGQTLRKMAEATPGGRYLPVATGTVDLGEVYLDLVAPADQKELEAKTIKRYEEKFQIFLAAAVLLLTAEGMIGRVLLICALALLPVLQPSPCLASARSLINAGNEAYNSGKFSEAQTLYDKALAERPDHPAAGFNKGDSLYRQGKFAEAEAAFAEIIAKEENPALLARSWFNRGNARFKNAEQKTDLQEKLVDLKESAGFYEKSLQLEANLAGAGRNLEICRRKIKEIERQLDEQEKKAREEQQQENTKQNQQQEEQQQPPQNTDAKQQEQQQEPPQKEGQQQPGGEQNERQEQKQQSGAELNRQEQNQDKTNSQDQAVGREQPDQAKERADQTVEAILNAEKKLQEMRIQRMRLAPDAVEKDW